MTTEATATIHQSGTGATATCYHCRTLLATRGADVRIVSDLEPRPTVEPITRLPRFGPIRRDGHRDRRSATGSELKTGRPTRGVTRSIGNPGAIYVNCPGCDRGQVVRWPS